MTTTKLVENVVSLEETKPTPEEPAVNEIIPEVVIDKPVTNDTVASVIVTNDTVIADEDIKTTTVSQKKILKAIFMDNSLIQVHRFTRRCTCVCMDNCVHGSKRKNAHEIALIQKCMQKYTQNCI